MLAVVRGSAVNQDGRSNGLTAPNTLAQRDVITRALRSADVAAGSVNFVETHGTGTALGDPIEFEALADVYGRGDGPCALGAVKTNIGHLEAAAGIAGFIKAALAVQRGQIPPNLHFSQWNPAIDPSPTRLFVPTDLAPWPDCDGPRRAAVSSFGLGGTNAHVVLEQGPDPAPVGSGAGFGGDARWWSRARRTSGWRRGRRCWPTGWRAPAPACRWPMWPTRSIITGRGTRRFATVCARRSHAGGGGVARAGRGSARRRGWWHRIRACLGRARCSCIRVRVRSGRAWARQLLADEPAFAAAVAELEPVFVEQVGFSLRQVLAAGEPVVGIDRIQPVLVGMQLALTELWRSYGVEPDAVIGHSMGEVTAAVVAGALSPADGLKVIATRSRLMSRLSGQGAMALLELDADGRRGVDRRLPGCDGGGVCRRRVRR